jgi:non-specific serine/threonine protein kinase
MPGNTSPELRVITLSALGGIAGFQGDPVHHHAFSEQGIDLGLACGFAFGVAVCQYVLVVAETMAGNYERAVELGQQAIARFRAEHSTHLLGLALCDTGFAALLDGKSEQGGAWSQEGLAIHRTEGNRWGEANHLSDLGFFAQQTGDLRQAAEHYVRSVRLQAEIGATWYMANPLSGLASIAAQQRRYTTAAHLLGAAAAIHEKSGSADPIIERGRNAQTRELVRLVCGDEVLQREMATGRTLSIAEVVALAGESGSGAGESAEPDPFGLSPREREVLRLLVDGQTDREIAEALFISPRTVGGHVSRILAKLDVETRRSARAFALRHGLN